MWESSGASVVRPSTSLPGDTGGIAVVLTPWR